MIGLALVTFVAVLSNSMKASNRGAIEEQIAADFVVTSQDGFTPFVAGAGEAAAQPDGVELATSVRAEVGKVAGIDKYVTGVEPDKIAAGLQLRLGRRLRRGARRPGRTGAIVDADFAEDHNLQVGDRFDFLSGSGRDTTLEVKATYDPPPFYQLLGSVSISKEKFDELHDRPRNQFTFINAEGGSTSAAQAPIDEALATFPTRRRRRARRGSPSRTRSSTSS